MKDVICLISILSTFSYLIQKRDLTERGSSQAITATSVMNDLIFISKYMEKEPFLDYREGTISCGQSTHRIQNSSSELF